jgi:hypothetical protein
MIHYSNSCSRGHDCVKEKSLVLAGQVDRAVNLRLRRTIQRLLVALLALFAVWSFLVIFIGNMQILSRLWGMDPYSDLVVRYTSDFLNLFAHAEIIRANLTLYWPWPEYGPHYMMASGPAYELGRQPYPPFLTPALSLVSGYGFWPLVLAWRLLLFAAFWVYAVCLARLAGRKSIGAVFVAAAAILFIPGIRIAFDFGNVEPILWAAVGLALLSPRIRGAGFAFVAMIKLYGAWPLLFAARREGWPVVRSALLALAAGVLLATAALGPGGFVQASLDWVRHMAPVIGQGTFNPGNVSLSFLPLRLSLALGLWEYEPGPLPGWARVYLTIVGILAPLLMGWLARKREPRLQYALICCAALLFSPLCWGTYLPVVLAPAAILWGALAPDRAIFGARASIQPSEPVADRSAQLAGPERSMQATI